MKRLVLVALLSGCGDNSRSCGEGTNDLDNDGECESDTGGNVVCGDGTRLDPITNDCAPDPDTCGGGTVLVNGRCQDPTAGLDIDLEEGPEPNAFETGAVPAGLITLEPIGEDGFVIHGCIKPLDDATPDLDVYQLTVAAPTLIDVTADGVQGLAGGFQVTTAAIPALATWRRFGINLSTDVSRRQIFLPAAGTYRFIVTDSRTLLPAALGLAVTPPAGNSDGTSCYFVTIDQQLPMPVALDPVAGDTSTITDDLKFYSGAALGGNTRITTTIMTPHAQPALVVMKNDVLFAFDDDGTNMMFDGTGNPLVVGDFVFNYSSFSSPYRLVVQ
jgi:hypothetical protein